MQNLANLKTKFKNKDLFDQSLTHKSWVNENPKSRGSNERLEFLGDAVLELIVTDYLYELFPNKSEGYLTALRSNIVNTTNLSKLAKTLKVRDHIFLSKGESQSPISNSLLADTIEAIIGAIYLDLGIEFAKKFITVNLLSDLDKKLKEPLKDAKSRFQEIVQSKKLASPKYKVITISGPEHDRQFTVEVFVNGKSFGRGIGKSKNEGEQKAARKALESESFVVK